MRWEVIIKASHSVHKVLILPQKGSLAEPEMFFFFLKHYTRISLDEDKRSLSGGAADRYYRKKSNTTPRVLDPLC